MFESGHERDITRGVAAEIPVVTQLLLWSLIDEFRKTRELDYLQVFELSVEAAHGETLQAVAHSQEQPPYRKKQIYRLPDAVRAKIFCIDDGAGNATMLLAEEY